MNEVSQEEKKKPNWRGAIEGAAIGQFTLTGTMHVAYTFLPKGIDILIGFPLALYLCYRSILYISKSINEK